MRPITGGLAALTVLSIAAPACANPLDGLRWRVEDALADTAARKVESVLSGEGRKPAKGKPAPAPAAAPASAPPAPPPPAAAAPPPATTPTAPPALPTPGAR